MYVQKTLLCLHYLFKIDFAGAGGVEPPAVCRVTITQPCAV